MLENKLKEGGYFSEEKRVFTFIESRPHNWQGEHHQSRPVESSNWERFKMKNGHIAFLGDSQFYDLVNGEVTSPGLTADGKKKYRIIISHAAIAKFDNFNFEEILPLGV